jgi:hypothetical protein
MFHLDFDVDDMSAPGMQLDVQDAILVAGILGPQVGIKNLTERRSLQPRL